MCMFTMLMWVCLKTNLDRSRAFGAMGQQSPRWICLPSFASQKAVWHLLFIDFIEFSSVACEIVARHTVDPEDGHFEGWNSCKPVDSSRKSPRPPVRSGTVLQAGGSCEVATLIRTKTIEVSGQN